jgi:hypothetical protein
MAIAIRLRRREKSTQQKKKHECRRDHNDPASTAYTRMRTPLLTRKADYTAQAVTISKAANSSPKLA